MQDLARDEIRLIGNGNGNALPLPLAEVRGERGSLSRLGCFHKTPHRRAQARAAARVSL